MDFLNYFNEPLGSGSIFLITLIMLLSTLIALFHYRRIRSVDSFLIADRDAKVYDFTFSQIGYAIGIATTIFLLPSLTYTYGPIFIPMTLLAIIISMLVFAFLLRNPELNGFLKKDYGLSRFVSGNFPDGKFVKIFSAIIIAAVYWGLFGIEIVALKTLFQTIFPSVSSIPILVLVFSLVIIYVNLSGYLGTMRTDGLQTMFLMIVLCYFGFFLIYSKPFLPSTMPNILSKQLFYSWQSISTIDISGIAIAWILLSIGALISSQDLWSRSTAVCQKGTSHANTYIGLLLSVFIIVPIIAIFIVGLWMHSKDPNLSNPEDLELIFGRLIILLKGQAPVGLLVATLFTVAISTADTALITSIQAARDIKPKLFDSLKKVRLLTITFGIIGLFMAFLFPNIISAVFAFSSIPLVFIPLILARMWKRGRKEWVANTVLIGGFLIGILSGILGGEVSKAGPILVFVFSILMYPLLHLIPFGGEKNE